MANTKTTLGFIAGISIGAIAGILLAPDKGAGTRKKLIDASADLANTVKKSIAGLLDHATPTAERMADEGTHSTSAGEQQIRKVMHNAKEAISQE